MLDNSPPNRSRWGHRASIVYDASLVAFVAAVLMAAFIPDEPHPVPLPVLAALVGLMWTVWIMELKWHSRCMYCLVPPDNPDHAAVTHMTWLKLFHASTAVRLAGLGACVAVGCLVGYWSAPALISNLGTAAGIVWAIVFGFARRHHAKLSLWCPMCDHGGDWWKDFPVSPAPNAPGAGR